MRRVLALAVLVAVALSGCGDEEMVVRTDADSGSEISVERGDRFVLRLESNPSTGYGWDIDAMTTEGLVELRSKSFLDSSEADLVGAAGVEVFEFEATGTGAGILRLAYVRSFDDPVVPERVAEYIVRIDGAPWPPEDGTEPPDTSTAAAPVEIQVLLDGGPTDDVTVSGFVVWTDTAARFCELLLESFPPQCGGAEVAIANPEALEVTLEEGQGIRWTQGRVDLRGSFDGDRFTLDG